MWVCDVAKEEKERSLKEEKKKYKKAVRMSHQPHYGLDRDRKAMMNDDNFSR